MRSKNVLFSLAVVLAACCGCTEVNSGSSTEMPEGTVLSPENVSVDDQIKKLQRKRDYCKARLYEETDEAMRNEFDNDWETYEGHLTKQEFLEERLKKLNAELEKLEKKAKKKEKKKTVDEEKKVAA